MTETHGDDDDDDAKNYARTKSAAVAAYLDEDPGLLHFTDQQNKTGCLLRDARRREQALFL